MKIQIYEDKTHLWRWRAVAENGRIIADGSEGYDSEWNAARAVTMVRDEFMKGDLRVDRLHPTVGPDTPPDALTAAKRPPEAPPVEEADRKTGTTL